MTLVSFEDQTKNDAIQSALAFNSGLYFPWKLFLKNSISMHRLQRLLALEFWLQGNVHGSMVLGFDWRGFYIYEMGHKWTGCRQSKFLLRQFQGHLRILAGWWLRLLFYVFHVWINFFVNYSMMFTIAVYNSLNVYQHTITIKGTPYYIYVNLYSLIFHVAKKCFR